MAASPLCWGWAGAFRSRVWRASPQNLGGNQQFWGVAAFIARQRVTAGAFRLSRRFKDRVEPPPARRRRGGAGRG